MVTASVNFATVTRDRVALVFTVESADEAYRALAAKGVTFVTEPHDHGDWGDRVAHFHDPNGTLIELFQSIPMTE